MTIFDAQDNPQVEINSDLVSKFLVLGWREWVALPELGLNLIKAKIDTGARTSTLHAYSIEYFQRQGTEYARFSVYPLQNRTDLIIHNEALIIDRRWVTDSGGHREERAFILTALNLAGRSWPIELSLTNRENMLFRMLLGRTALATRAVVDPARSFLTGRVKKTWKFYSGSAAIRAKALA